MEYEQNLADIHCSGVEQDLSKNFQEERHCKFLQWSKCLYSLNMTLAAEFPFQCPRRMKDRQTFVHAISQNLHLLAFNQTIHRVLSNVPSVHSLLLSLREHPQDVSSQHIIVSATGPVFITFGAWCLIIKKMHMIFRTTNFVMWRILIA